MNPKLAGFAKVFAAVFYLVVAMAALLLCSCQTDRNAGMVAARESGMGHYLSFTRDGLPDSAAMLPYSGYWWFYHPSKGSMRTPSTVWEEPYPLMHLMVKGASGRAVWRPVTPEPKQADLQLGCLPLALADQRKGGGVLVVTNNGVGPSHIETVRQKVRRLRAR